MAAASKINAVSLALLLPAVEAVRFARLKPKSARSTENSA
jgi:hypothetical protein